MTGLFKTLRGRTRPGIPAGVYAYGYDLSPGAARISAAQVIEAVKPYRLEYPVCYDQEYEEVLMALSRTQRTEICAAFLETVQKSRYYAMLYASKDWLEHWVFDEQLTDYDKWVAQYADACTYQGEFGIWQYGVMGEEGVKGQITPSPDRCRGSRPTAMWIFPIGITPESSARPG